MKNALEENEYVFWRNLFSQMKRNVFHFDIWNVFIQLVQMFSFDFKNWWNVKSSKDSKNKCQVPVPLATVKL